MEWALGWGGGKELPPGGTRMIGQQRTWDSATLVLNHYLEPSSALPSWHLEPLMIRWPLLGAPSLTVARLGRPFPPFLGKGPAERRVVGGW